MSEAVLTAEEANSFVSYVEDACGEKFGWSAGANSPEAVVASKRHLAWLIRHRTRPGAYLDRGFDGKPLRGMVKPAKIVVEFYNTA